jgi:hypothetical protein
VEHGVVWDRCFFFIDFLHKWMDGGRGVICEDFGFRVGETRLLVLVSFPPSWAFLWFLSTYIMVLCFCFER